MKAFSVSSAPARLKAIPGTAFRNARGSAAILLATLLATVAADAEEVTLDACPDPVRATIQAHIHDGRLDEINRLEVEDRVLFLVEIDLKGFRDLTLHITGTGSLQKSVEEIRLPDLPQAVRNAVAKVLEAKGRVEEVEKVVTEDRVEYRVEIERPKVKDVVYVFAEDGTLLSQK